MKPTDLRRGDLIQVTIRGHPVNGVFLRYRRESNSKLIIEFINFDLYDPEEGPYVDKLFGEDKLDIIEPSSEMMLSPYEKILYNKLIKPMI